MKKLFSAILMFTLLLAFGSSCLAATPTDDEVIAAYHNARVVYNWFDLKQLPTNGRSKKETGYMIYYNVNYPGIRTMSELRNECNKVFTPDLTSLLLTRSRAYREFNGGLYVAPAGRGTNIYAGDIAVKVLRDAAAPDKMTVQVTTFMFKDVKHTIPDNPQIRNFTYVNTPAGWRFSTFKAVK